MKAQADPDSTELGWKAYVVPVLPNLTEANYIISDQKDTSCTVIGDAPGYFKIYSFPKKLNYFDGDSCFLAVTMQNTTTKFVGAWKISSTNSTEERGFYYFLEDGSLYKLEKKVDGKFHYNSKNLSYWIQTADLDNNVYVFRLDERKMTTSSGSDGVSSFYNESVFSIGLKANDDGTFQIQTSSPKPIEKIAEDLLCDDAQSQES